MNSKVKGYDAFCTITTSFFLLRILLFLIITKFYFIIFIFSVHRGLLWKFLFILCTRKGRIQCLLSITPTLVCGVWFLFILFNRAFIFELNVRCDKDYGIYRMWLGWYSGLNTNKKLSSLRQIVNSGCWCFRNFSVPQVWSV